MLKIFFTNLPVKIASLIIATSLWFIVTSAQNRTDIFPGLIPVDLRNTPQDMVAISDLDGVKLKISAEASLWSSISADSFKAYVDLNGLNEGIYDLPIQVYSKKDGVRIIEKKPSHTLIRIEPSVTKTVPVVVKTVGEPKKGFAYLSSFVDPEEVKVSGAKSTIERISEATITVDISDRSEKFTTSADVKAIDSKGETIKELKFDPSQVKITTSFTKESSSKTVGIKVKTAGELPSGLQVDKITVDPPVVTISGSIDAIRKVSSVETEQINLSDIDRSQTLDVSFKLPTGVTTTDVPNLKVTIELKMIEISREISVPVSIVDIPLGLSLQSVNPQEITAVVKGDVDKVQGLSSRDLKAAVSAKSASKGENKFTVGANNISAPEGVNVVEVKSPNITLVLN